MFKKARLPIALTLCAIIATATALWWPYTKVVAAHAPIDLQAGAITVVEFRAEVGDTYTIGIEMDGTVAKPLFPCSVDPEAWGNNCVGPTLPTPPELSLFSGGADVSSLLRQETSRAGGNYWRDGDQETFVRPIAYANLTRGKNYRLVAHSITDGSSVAPAKPKLRVALIPFAYEGEAISRGLTLYATIFACLICVIWTGVSLLFGRKR